MNGELSAARLGRLRTVLGGHVERGEVPGLVALVSRRGETHVETIGTLALGGGGPMRRDTVFRIASLTKPITAVAAMILVEECRLRLDDPVDDLLPELAGRRVLERPDGPLEATVPAARPIILRDLLTFRFGIGMMMTPPGRHPVQQAMDEAGLAPGPDTPPLDPDEWMRRLGTLPLMYQPGTEWLYHTGSDVLGVLIARATGGTFGEFLRERIFEPLGMADTGFHVRSGTTDRLPTGYRIDPETGALVVHDDPATGRGSGPPAFQSGGGGLVSTADDLLAFFRMLLRMGRYGRGRARILSRPSVEVMTTDQLTPEQAVRGRPILADDQGWGFGMAVVTRRDDLAASPGRFGWNGGTGTTAYADPAEDLVGILLTQRHMSSPRPPRVFSDFWTSAYQSIDD